MTDYVLVTRESWGRLLEAFAPEKPFGSPATATLTYIEEPSTYDKLALLSTEELDVFDHLVREATADRVSMSENFGDTELGPVAVSLLAPLASILAKRERGALDIRK